LPLFDKIRFLNDAKRIKHKHSHR